MASSLSREFHEMFAGDRGGTSSSEVQDATTAKDGSKKSSSSRLHDRSRLRARVHKNRPGRYAYDQVARAVDPLLRQELEQHFFGFRNNGKEYGVIGGAGPLATGPGSKQGIKGASSLPFLIISDNPSSFAVYSTIRQAVFLEKLRREFVTSQSVGTRDGRTPDEEKDGIEEASPAQQVTPLPKVVGIGLSMVFELIRESRSTNPALCSRALNALLDTLQGQTPEGLKKEPPEVTSALFDLLLEISSSPLLPTRGNEDETSIILMMRSAACSCLLSLVVALGDTGKILRSVSSLLTNPTLKSYQQQNLRHSSLGADEIETPGILVNLQRSVHGVVLGRTTRPTWSSTGFPKDSLCDSFSVKDALSTSMLHPQLSSSSSSGSTSGIITFSNRPSVKKKSLSSSNNNNQTPPQQTNNHSSSLSFDGKFLYLLYKNYLYKIGSGYGGSIKGQLVASRRMTTSSNITSVPPHYGTSGNNSTHPSSSSGYPGWIGWINGYLYYHPAGEWSFTFLLKLDCESLKEVAKIFLSFPSSVSSLGPTVASTDGEHLILVSSSLEDDSFSLRAFKTSSLSPSPGQNYQTSNPSPSSSSSSLVGLPSYLMPVVQEVKLKLAHKSILVCGPSGSLSSSSGKESKKENQPPSDKSESQSDKKDRSLRSSASLSPPPTPKKTLLSTFSSSLPVPGDTSSSHKPLCDSAPFKKVSFPSLRVDEEPAQILVGKDFSIIRTSTGRVFFTGRSQSLGIKHFPQPVLSQMVTQATTSSSPPTSPDFSRWAELPISKNPRISHISVGHESSHVTLVSEDGQVYFCGSSKRGEDGDITKGSSASSSRRQSKPSKPKKMSRLEGKVVVHSSSNHGTSVVVTKEGEVYMFGKDTSHVDRTTGLLIGLTSVKATQVALGKAHALILSDSGQLYSFGYNHKGQCGRQESTTSSGSGHGISSLAKEGTDQSNSAEEESGSGTGGDSSLIDMSEDVTEPPGCSFGNHRWKVDQCMICPYCNNCTGYGARCVAQQEKIQNFAMASTDDGAEDTDDGPGGAEGGMDERLPFTHCGCGTGHSGCADCGICQSCDREWKAAINPAFGGGNPPPQPGNWGGPQIFDPLDAPIHMVVHNVMNYGAPAPHAANGPPLRVGRGRGAPLDVRDVRLRNPGVGPNPRIVLQQYQQIAANAQLAMRRIVGGGFGPPPPIFDAIPPPAGAVAANIYRAPPPVRMPMPMPFEADFLRNELLDFERDQDVERRRQRLRQYMQANRNRQMAAAARYGGVPFAPPIDGWAAIPAGRFAAPPVPRPPLGSFRDGSFDDPPVPVNPASKVALEDSASQATGSDCESSTKLTSLPPSKVVITGKVTQISCGLHHSIVLTERGEVFSFGSNSQGQLGLGDFTNRDKPTKVLVPGTIVKIAAGSHHTLLLSSKGEVYSFGSNSKGQLGRLGGPSESSLSTNSCYPSLIPSLGPPHGRRAVDIHASGDYSFIIVDQSLINPSLISSVKAAASMKYVIIVPPPNGRDSSTTVSGKGSSSEDISSLIISRSDGTCKTFTRGEENPLDSSPLIPEGSLDLRLPQRKPQLDLWSFSSLFLDRVFDLMWTFNGETMSISRYSLLASEGRMKLLQPRQPENSDTITFLSPEVTLPFKEGSPISRSLASINLLSSLDLLTRSSLLGLTIQEDDPSSKSPTHRSYTKEDFSTVNRFDSHGGGWGYSGHSTEAIRFSPDTDILLGGVGLFGGRGEYIAKVRIYDIGVEGGENEGEGELMIETGDIPYECGARQKFSLLFEEPAHLSANRWYVVWAMITGPSSDCGSSGQSVVTTEDQVTFFFKGSKKSNNGTDVNAGQIPTLLYRVISPADLAEGGNVGQSRESDVAQESPITILSRDFSLSPSPDCFSSLLHLLKWSWTSFRSQTMEDNLIVNSQSLSSFLRDIRELAFVSLASLRLIKVYVTEVYPYVISSKKTTILTADVAKIAQSVGDVRAVLKAILTDGDSSSATMEQHSVISSLSETILSQTAETFQSCFHAFYPSSLLRWRGLCDLLLVPTTHTTVKESLLSVFLSSLTRNGGGGGGNFVRLTFPLHQSLELKDSTLTSPSDIPSPPGIVNDFGGCDGDLVTDPILVEKMTEVTDRERCHTGMDCSFRDVLMKLLAIIAQPVEYVLYSSIDHRSDVDSDLTSPDDNSSQPESSPLSPQLVSNSYYLLSSVVSELTAHSIGLSVPSSSATTTGILYSTPNRFPRVTPNRTWNTGNGSPDAICFSVDKHVSIAGVTLFGGSGSEWTYQLEVLEYSGSTSLDEPLFPGRDDVRLLGRPPRPTAPSSCSSLQWNQLESTSGSYAILPTEEEAIETAEVRFSKPIPIKPGVKYALRLRNHGSKTLNGDGGVSVIRGPDGTNFTFSDCALSLNGTSHSRGQIPSILYYSSGGSATALSIINGSQGNQATSAPTNYQEQQPKPDQQVSTRNVLVLLDAVMSVVGDLLTQALSSERVDVIKAIGDSVLISRLLPSLLSFLLPLATKDPKSTAQVIMMVKKLLPLVVSANKFLVQEGVIVPSTTTTSKYYSIVESEHPYRPATISSHRVSFPPTVKYMTIEFDPTCSTVQTEDYLQLAIPSMGKRRRRVSRNLPEKSGDETFDDLVDFWPVFPKFSGFPSGPSAEGDKDNKPLQQQIGNWPTRTIILPGNELLFSLETASTYVPAPGNGDNSFMFGFRAQVVGFDSPSLEESESGGFPLVEQELSFLSVSCVSTLLSRSLSLTKTPQPSLEEEESITKSIRFHPLVLSRGFTLSRTPTVVEALDDSLPLSSEKPFLQDFINSTMGTSGGRLARWLQPESYVDPTKCTVEVEGNDQRGSGDTVIPCSSPVVITITTKDQYGKIVNCPQLRVEVTAQPFTSHAKSLTQKEVSDVSKPTWTPPFANEDVSSIKITNANLVRSSSSSLMSSVYGRGFLEVGDLPPYNVTVKERMKFHSITMMPAYEGFSFEELRFLAPVKKKSFESLMVRSSGSEGTFTASWIPTLPGFYQIVVSIDGQKVSGQGLDCVQVAERSDDQDIPENKEITVKTVQSISPMVASSCNQPIPSPYRLRKFIGGETAGIRVRSLPTLQSPPIGTITPGGVVSIIDEITNEDGVWVRLSSDSILKFCSPCSPMLPPSEEAYILSFNQHTGQALLVSVGEDDSVFLLDRPVIPMTTSSLPASLLNSTTSGVMTASRPSRLSVSPAHSLEMPLGKGQGTMSSSHRHQNREKRSNSDFVGALSRQETFDRDDDDEDEGTFVLEQSQEVENDAFMPGTSTTGTAMSNSFSVCIRSIFASLLWHEGILNDAIAASTYLKFNASLTKSELEGKWRSPSSPTENENGQVDNQSQEEEEEIPETLLLLIILWEQVVLSMSGYRDHGYGFSLMTENASFLLKLSSAVESSTVVQTQPGDEWSVDPSCFESLDFLGVSENSRYRRSLAEASLTQDEILQVIQEVDHNLIRPMEMTLHHVSEGEDEDASNKNKPCPLPKENFQVKMLDNARLEDIAPEKSNDNLAGNSFSESIGATVRIHPPLTRNIKSVEQSKPILRGHETSHGQGKKTDRYSMTNDISHHPSLVCRPSSHLLRICQTFVSSSVSIRQSSNQPTPVISDRLTSLATPSLHPLPLIHHPVLRFILDDHNLPLLTTMMSTSMRKAVCREFSLKILNWLLHSLSQPISLHDVFWSFIESLSSQPMEKVAGTNGDQKISTTPPRREQSQELDDWNSKSEGDQKAPPNYTVSSLQPAPILSSISAPSVKRQRSEDTATFEADNLLSIGISGGEACLHPLNDLSLAGENVLKRLSTTFHTFLQSVSDLMLLLPVSSPIQTSAVRCFFLHFDLSDHSFLHRCHVFSNINKILARTEGEFGGHISSSEGDLHSNMGSPTKSFHKDQITVPLEQYSDLTQDIDIKTSSRTAMNGSLTDHSTETFWESGDEDRNKTKVITLTVPSKSVGLLNMKAVYVYIDNVRDPGHRVSQVIFKCSSFSPEAGQEDKEGNGQSAVPMVKLHTAEPDPRTFAGWISCSLPYTPIATLRIEIKGPDNGVRVRQVSIIGVRSRQEVPKDSSLPRPSSSASFVTSKVSGQLSSGQIQQMNCESETLRVFRLLTSQAFGKLISAPSPDICERDQDFPVAEQPGQSPSAAFLSTNLPTPSTQLQPSSIPETTESSDLREHMVGILFSRSRDRLSHLQKQVCSHIVSAIRSESVRLREEWESLLCSPQSPSSTTGPQPPENIQSDAFCFEMLSMVLALSGSSVGRRYLSQQSDLLLDLFSLLHTAGSARVQRQVISLLRRVLPEIMPSDLADLLGVKRLPVGVISENRDNNNRSTFDIQDMGILDVLLSVVAKALTVQTKVRGGGHSTTTGTSGRGHQRVISTVTLATAIHPKDDLGSRWFLRGCIPRKLAEMVMSLIHDMSSGKFGDSWRTITKSAVAENILNMTRLPEELRNNPSDCVKTPTFWLNLASLCVLTDGDAERLSSTPVVAGVTEDQDNGNSPASSKPVRPFCDNHDDGETIAIILCSSGCGNLCSECDRFLHLHRRTKNHQRQIFKEEEEAIKVDLHEGCGRSKLFWLLSLADSKTLKAMAEFRLSGGNDGGITTSVARSMSLVGSGASLMPISNPVGSIPDGRMSHSDYSYPHQTVTHSAFPSTGTCRFCGATGNSGLLAIGNVCSEPECQSYASTACSKIHPCGHLCGGVKDEETCLPCLHGCSTTTALKQDADDMCMICFTEALSSAPAIQLGCGHVFHHHCCQSILHRRWPGPRITFTFSQCPICKVPMSHPSLEDLLKPIRSLWEDVKKKALMRLEYEGLIKSDGARGDPITFSMERYAYYVCCKCAKAYYGGEARCDVEAAAASAGAAGADRRSSNRHGQNVEQEYDPNELVCGGCSDVSRAQMCPKHGTDFLEYKCRYCCSVAVFFCFGTTHFCDACHNDFRMVTNMVKDELPHCPAGPRGRQLEGTECPLHVKHPPTGEEFALGCGICRNTHTF